MAEDDVIRQIYRLEMDQAKLRELQSGSASAQKFIQAVTDKVKEQSVTMQRGGQVAVAYVQGIENQKSALLELEEAARGANQQQEKLVITNEKAAKSSSAGGGGGGVNVGTIARNLGGLGLGGVADIANVADDVKDLFEQIQKGGQSIPLVVNAAEAMTPALGASAAGFAAIAIPLAAVAAVAAAVALGVKAFNDELEKNREATKLAIEGLQRETDLKNQNITDARTRTAAENLQAANDLQQQFDNQEELLGKLEAQRKAVDDEYAALGNSLNPQRRAQLGDQGAALDKAIEDASKVLISLGEQVENTVRVLGPEVDARQKERDAIEAATKAQKEHEEAVKKATEEQKKQDAEIEQARKQLLTVNEQIADSEKRRGEQLTNRAKEDSRTVETGALEAKIAAAQEVEAAQDKQKKIIQLRAEGGDAEAQALQKQQERVDQINSQFFASQQKALKSYLTSEQRATEDYSVARIRKVQDLYTSLTNLASTRDVAAFVNTRAAGLTDISRGDTDAGTASRRRLEDYRSQASEADATRQRQLSDLRVANEKENAARREQLNARIAQEIAAGQGQLKQSEILQQQLAALRARYASEDLIARRRSEDEAYATQIGKLRARQSELNAIIGGTLNPTVSFFRQIGTAIAGMFNQARQAAVSYSSSDYVRAGQKVIAQYDLGTNYVPQTGIYKLHKGERVVTAAENRSYNPSWSKSSGMQVIINNPMFGAIATPSDVAAGQEFIIRAIEQATGAA